MAVVRSLQSLLAAGASPSDTDLLARFVRDRDQGAFELLVWRHSGLVLRACRAVLGDSHTAEDALQATFLALARNAPVVGRRGTVAGWLYQVARRVAVRARRRDVRQSAAVTVPSGDLAQIPAPAPSSGSDAETVRLLHEELARLPARYREPLLLCYLEGLTQADAAQRLGWPIGTVATRVTRAKERLGRRLMRRGVAIPVVGLFADCAGAVRALEPAFVRATVEAAVRYYEEPSASNVSAAVLSMAREVKSMSAIRFAWAVGVLAVGVLIIAACATIAEEGSHGPEAEPPYARSGVRFAPVPKAPARIGRLAFLEEGRLASIRPDGTDLTWHTPEWARGHNDLDSRGPRIDPAGKRVVYGVEVAGGLADPYVRNSSIRIRTLDKDGPEVEMGVEGRSWCWSPDGTRIAVSAVEKSTAGELTTRTRIVDVGTKTATVVKLPSGHLVTDWSPDGAWFLTRAPSYMDVSGRQVTVMKTDGTAAERLNDAKEAAHTGRFSPDGKMVLFDTFDYRTREGRLYTVPIAGGRGRPSSRALQGAVMGLCWSPDGKRVASVWRRHYAKPEKNQKAEFFLRLADPDGGNETVIRKETGQMPASETEPFQQHWVTMSGLDWR